jgi:hypothetical protein
MEILIPEKEFVYMSGSSKGYAKKACVGGKWYKVSAGAFNAQAEVVASRLAAYTNLPSYVKYDLCKINGEWGTVSDDFIGGRRYETVKGLHIKTTMSPIEEVMETVTGRDLFNYVNKMVLDNLGLDFTQGLNLLLRFDALILNEDRHFRNIKFIETEPNKWEMVKPFDFDCSFYSCVEDLETVSEYKDISQPFFGTHAEQLKFMSEKSEEKLTLKPFNPDELIAGVWTDSYDIGKKEVLSYLETIKQGGVF